ncbi:iron dicitrate transport regulator FecR [Pseudomonas sp. C2B4]|nr:FecR domain-containing protein [Pseudomonas sp. C2B4]NUU39150.1 iron dicitrate transport regulator FecR [Pseudomonas sp. C2B4]
MPSPTPRKPRKALSAAALLVLLGAGLAWFDPAYQTEQYRTVIGERRVVKLVDGSRMTLDSDSRATVAWHLRSRRVQLQTGQALFDVSKTLVRPFRVDAGAAQVKVLGTLFSVSHLNDAVRVTLVRGAVSVNDATEAGHSVQLVPGQQVEVRQKLLQSPVTVDTDAAIAWKDSRLIFERTPLAEALAQIQRYRKPAIVLDDPSLANLPISGVFDNRNVEDLLNLLPSILPLSLSTEFDGTLHVRRKAAKK